MKFVAYAVAQGYLLMQQTHLIIIIFAKNPTRKAKTTRVED